MPSIDEILAKRQSKVKEIKKTEKEQEAKAALKSIDKSRFARPWQISAPEQNTESLGTTPAPSKAESKIERKPVTYGVQTGNKQVTNEDFNGVQTGNKPVTNGVQTGNKQVTKLDSKTQPVTRLENKQVTERVTGGEANGVQTGNKQVTNPHFETLRGHEAKLLWLVFNKCRSTGELLSPPITLDQISSHLLTAKNTAKTIVSRVVKKGFFTRESSATGRGGFTRFRIEKSLYQGMLISETDNKQVTNGVQTDNKQVTKRVTERVTSAPIVVVSNSISENTTTIEPEKADGICFVIPPELSGKVSRRQLTELVTAGKTSETDLQLSLDAFAYDLRHNLISLKHSSNPIGLLIGAIKNNGSYNSAKYIEALKSELKPFVESQRDATLEKTNQRNSKEWGIFQKFKLENPEEYKKLEAKIEKYGLKGALLEDFTFLEYKKEILKSGDEPNLNPLRPAERTI